MSIEASHPPPTIKPLFSAEHRSSKKSGSTDSADQGAAGGFSALMNLLADAAPQNVLVTNDTTVAPEIEVNGENWHLDPEEKAQEAIDNIAFIADLSVFTRPDLPTANLAPVGFVPQDTTLSTLATLTPALGNPSLVTRPDTAVTNLTSAEVSVAAALPATSMPTISLTPQEEPLNTLAALPPTLQGPTEVAAMRTINKVTPKQQHLPVSVASSGQQGMALAVANQLSAQDRGGQPSQNRASVLPMSSPEQEDLRAAKSQQSLWQPAAAAADAPRLVSTQVGAEMWLRPQDRVSAKILAAQPGAGYESLLGSKVADQLGISASYEVAATSALVSDTQVAETVSYWVTHGVQNAELTLDGIGNEPVEVRISLNGDQAQIDFRSNQPEIRQVLEGASAQLKAMLSSEGLQLTGMSVGTSGQGGAQQESRQPQSTVLQTRLFVQPLAVSAARVANLAVGQSLDMYV
jgi:flagellar hook-length control protein FliK